jgi:hypothetical protein
MTDMPEMLMTRLYYAVLYRIVLEQCTECWRILVIQGSSLEVLEASTYKLFW